jgi:hypothetical protein
VTPLLVALRKYTGYHITLVAGRVEVGAQANVEVVGYVDAVIHFPTEGIY